MNLSSKASSYDRSVADMVTKARQTTNDIALFSVEVGKSLSKERDFAKLTDLNLVLDTTINLFTATPEQVKKFKETQNSLQQQMAETRQQLEQLQQRINTGIKQHAILTDWTRKSLLLLTPQHSFPPHAQNSAKVHFNPDVAQSLAGLTLIPCGNQDDDSGVFLNQDAASQGNINNRNNNNMMMGNTDEDGRDAVITSLQQDCARREATTKWKEQRIEEFLAILSGLSHFTLASFAFMSTAYKKDSPDMNVGLKMVAKDIIEVHAKAHFSKQNTAITIIQVIRECVENYDEIGVKGIIEKINEQVPRQAIFDKDGPFIFLLERFASVWFAEHIMTHFLGDIDTVVHKYISKDAWFEILTKWCYPILPKSQQEARNILSSTGGEMLDLSKLTHYKNNSDLTTLTSKNNGSPKPKQNSHHDRRNGAGKGNNLFNTLTPIFNSPPKTDRNNNNNSNTSDNTNNDNSNNNNQTTTNSTSSNALKWLDDPKTTPEAIITHAKKTFAPRCWKCNLWSPELGQSGTPMHYTHPTEKCTYWEDNGTLKKRFPKK